MFWEELGLVARKREENREFQSQWQREAWSRQGLGEQSQQKLRSNSDLALQLAYVKAWPVACINL